MAINGQYICIELNDCKTQLKAKSHTKNAEIVEKRAYWKTQVSVIGGGGVWGGGMQKFKLFIG